MRAREDGSLWSCYNGVAIDGPSRGKGFPRIPAYLCQLSEWLEEHPDSEVLQWTHHPLHQDPRHGHGTWFHYAGFGPHPHALATMLDGQFDDRLPESELVLGICHSGEVIAFSLSEIHRQGCLIQETLGNDPVVVWSRSPASAWMAAFHRNVDGTPLDFEFADGGFRDLQTGTLWSVEGRAVEGPQTGKTLTPLDFVSVKWNAWSGFHPHTKVYLSESPARLNIDHSDFQPLFDSLDNAGFPVEVEKEWMQSSLPPAAQRGLDIRIAGDAFQAFLFESAGAANDFASSRLLIPKDLYISFFVGEAPSDLARHAAASGPFVLESNPEVQYTDPESLKRLPEEDIKWSPLLDNPDFQNALTDLAASSAYSEDTTEGSFGTLFTTLSGDGYEVRQVKPMMRKWLRPKTVSGYSALIAGDRFLIYQFDSPGSAAAYQAERHHTVQAGPFVFRSDPPDQYQMATEQTIDRPVEQIHWSTLLEEQPFLQTLVKIG
jgi:Protein of unknown function (DUF3179)